MQTNNFPDFQLTSQQSWYYGPDETMLISKAIGYTLKIIKSGKAITKFGTKINSIKHGDYDQFFNVIKQPSQFMLLGSFDNGGFKIKDDNFSQSGGDCDVAMIIAVDNCLKKFYAECWNEYGDIIDNDMTDTVFNKCAAFEIAIRVQNNNLRASKNIPYDKSETFDLVNVIDELCSHKNIQNNERLILQNGRKFLNMVKHYKNQFTSWEIGVNAFEQAWNTCGIHNIRLV